MKAHFKTIEENTSKMAENIAPSEIPIVLACHLVFSLDIKKAKKIKDGYELKDEDVDNAIRNFLVEKNHSDVYALVEKAKAIADELDDKKRIKLLDISELNNLRTLISNFESSNASVHI